MSEREVFAGFIPGTGYVTAYLHEGKVNREPFLGWGVFRDATDGNHDRHVYFGVPVCTGDWPELTFGMQACNTGIFQATDTDEEIAAAITAQMAKPR